MPFKQFFFLFFLLPAFAASLKCATSSPNSEQIKIEEFVPTSQKSGCAMDLCLYCADVDECKIEIIQRRYYANLEQLQADEEFKKLCGSRKTISMIDDDDNDSRWPGNTVVDVDKIFEEFGFRVRPVSPPFQPKTKMDGKSRKHTDAQGQIPETL